MLEDGKVDQGGRGWRNHDQPLAEEGGRVGRHDGLLGLSSLALHLLVVDVVVVEVAHQVHTLLRAEGDEAEAPVSLGDLVHQHDAVLHTACTKHSITDCTSLDYNDSPY